MQNHIFKIIGGACGLALGVLFLVLGFWKTMLIAVLVGLGVLIGHRLDSGRTFRSWIAKWAGKIADSNRFE